MLVGKKLVKQGLLVTPLTNGPVIICCLAGGGGCLGLIVPHGMKKIGEGEGHSFIYFWQLVSKDVL